MNSRFITFETVSEPIDPDVEQLTVKPLFARIVGALEAKGVEFIEPPAEWDSYGWYADYQVGSANLTCMMQRSDAWLILISSNRSLMDRLKGRHYNRELDEFSGLVVSTVQETTGVPVKLFNSEAEFRAG
ncbi:hypothetical protein ACI5KX_05360 [Erythrobacter sp. GH1-10]|uniref:hypothetical protein n=1 Tax=Erythrobacter sp. GH1-10 TaxID=3349334 RepID=UPI003878134D